MSDANESPPEWPSSVRFEKGSHRRTLAIRVTIGVAIVFVAGFGVRALLPPDPSIIDAPPPSILGTWVSEDARYADRGFTILVDEFQLQVGPDQVFAYPIERIRRVEMEAYTEYEIIYLTPDGEGVHEMTVDADGSGRLRNPRGVVWTLR